MALGRAWRSSGKLRVGATITLLLVLIGLFHRL